MNGPPRRSGRKPAQRSTAPEGRSPKGAVERCPQTGQFICYKTGHFHLLPTYRSALTGIHRRAGNVRHRPGRNEDFGPEALLADQVRAAARSSAAPASAALLTHEPGSERIAAAPSAAGSRVLLLTLGAIITNKLPGLSPIYQVNSFLTSTTTIRRRKSTRDESTPWKLSTNGKSLSKMFRIPSMKLQPDS